MPSVLCVCREFTPGIKALGLLAYTSMVATHRDNHMMDKQDAKDTLTFVVVRLVTRAAKRAAEEEAAAGGTSVWTCVLVRPWRPSARKSRAVR